MNYIMSNKKKYYSIFVKFEDQNYKIKYLYLCNTKEIALKKIKLFIDEINSTIKDLDDDFEKCDYYQYPKSVENGYCLDDSYECNISGDWWKYKFLLNVQLVYNDNGIIQLL